MEIDIRSENQKLLDSIVNKIRETGLIKHVDSIIISGSFGRNEPTYHIENGQIIYESDMEMILVYNNWFNLFNIKKQSDEIKKCFPELDLELIPISASRLDKVRNHNYSLFTPAKKTLFTFDFYDGSRTIYGKEHLKNKVKIEDVDNFEGKRIIANRVAELVYIRNHNGSLEEQNRWLAKIVLSLGTAFLIETREYKSSYHNQLEAIGMSKSVSTAFDNEFINIYIKAFDYLREGKKTTSFIAYEPSIKEYVGIAYEYYKKNKVNKSMTSTAYILTREAILLLKYDKRFFRCVFNPKELILDNVIHSYIEDKSNMAKWAEMWKKVLN